MIETPSLSPCLKSGFPDFESVEPKDLLAFTKEYIAHAALLKTFLEAHQNQSVELLIKRIDHSGLFNEKIMFGRIGKIEGKQFIFSTHDTMSSGYHEHPIDMVLRFDNVLGHIPMLPEASNIKLLKVSNIYKPFVKALAAMRKMLAEHVGTQHLAMLHYRYSEDNHLFRNGNYFVECEILKVNRSNVKYKHIRTMAYLDNHQKYIDIIPRDDHDRFIASDRYLKEVHVYPGRSSVLNVYDDEE